MSKRGTNPNSLKALAENRNTRGQRNAATVAFSRTLRELIVKAGEKLVSQEGGKPIKQIAAVVNAVYAEARKGNMQAVDFIAQRVEGKVKDELEQHGEMVIRIEREGSNPNPANTAPGTGTHQA